MTKHFCTTTAIAYPNGDPHVGQAYEAVATDAVARFKRLDGYDVFFLTGTDEHGQKIQQTAARQDKTPQQFIDEMTPKFQEMVAALGCSNDAFIRTSDALHKATVAGLWKRMRDAGDIYLSKYAGWYSVRDEAYYTGDETELREGKRYSAKTNTPVEWVEEESYFFRLSAFGEKLLAHYDAHPDFVGPQERRNEVTSFVKGGLQDLSVSRTTFDWGVPVPDAPGHVMYVWVDALTNYLSATGWPEQGPRSHFWPCDLHMIGKDIVRFHAVYWPAFLMSAGLPLPRRIFAHGFIFNRGEKMSKSLGNVVAPADLVAEYGVDQVRYFFLREISFGQDGHYSHEAIVNRINADLANDLGNLAQRSLSMIAKNLDSRIPRCEPVGHSAGHSWPEAGHSLSSQSPVLAFAIRDVDRQMLSAADSLLAECREHHEAQALTKSLDCIWKVVADANRYFAAQEPWALKKTDPDRMEVVLYVTAEVLRIVGILIQPYVPTAADKLLTLLAIPVTERSFTHLGERLKSGTPLPAPVAIFPRYEAKV